MPTDLKREWLRLPRHTTLVMGACAGRYCSAVILALSPEFPVFVIDEVPNYHYVGDGEIELRGLTTVEWGELVVRTWAWWITHIKGEKAWEKCSAWVDPDTDFIRDLKRCKLFLKKNNRGPELRTEITREYFHTNSIFLAPWLDVLPGEITRARWPPEESSSGQIRAKGQDYSLDSLEQILSRRPKAKHVAINAPSTYLQRYLAENRLGPRPVDSHLGGN